MEKSKFIDLNFPHLISNYNNIFKKGLFPLSDRFNKRKIINLSDFPIKRDINTNNKEKLNYPKLKRNNPGFFLKKKKKIEQNSSNRNLIKIKYPIGMLNFNRNKKREEKEKLINYKTNAEQYGLKVLSLHLLSSYFLK